VGARTLKLTIAALGGQGGGVLSDWLTGIAEASGYIVQSTSVPGVAQRTGATIYYLEFFPRTLAQGSGREPIMALMPVPGDVDCVVASELAEAGRAIQRGLVSEQTTLIASTHRAYAISEKSTLGRVGTDRAQLLEMVLSQGARAIVFDMEAIAERRHSVVSAVLLGAISGAGVLPFPRQSFEDAIRRSGIAVDTNLAAFADAHAAAAAGDSPPAAVATAGLVGDIPASARAAGLQGLLDRIRALPPILQPLVLEGARRALDYQDAEYAGLFLARIERLAAVDAQVGGASAFTLSQATARSLALWMTSEDTIRVADLKTRASRFERVRQDVRAAPRQLLGITEFMRPRVQEIAGTLPARLGRRVLRSPRACSWLGRFTGGKTVRTHTVSGFLLLYLVAGLRRWRRATLRFQEENAHIEDWLARIERLAHGQYALGVELARAQRLIKGYGETHERGWRNFSALVAQLDLLAGRSDGAVQLARLQDAALADEEGAALARALTTLAGGSRASGQPMPA
jgi:indolepyruvate ferredoxin oxidoreductase, beta subunit